MSKNDKTIIIHNDFREAPIGELSSTGHNVLWTFMYMIKEKNIEELKSNGRTDIEVRTSDFIDLSKYNRRHRELFAEFDKIANTLQNFRVHISDGDMEGTLVPFPLITHNKDFSVIKITVLREFAYLVDFIFMQGNFSKLLLSEVNGLKSKYAKIAYYYLSTYKNTGIWSTSIDEFKSIMNINDSYKPKDIRRRIVEPIGAELSQYFENLQYFEKRGKRQQIERIVWMFKPKELSIQGEIMRGTQKEVLHEGDWITKKWTK